MITHTTSQGIVLRKMGGQFDAAWQLAGGAVPAGRSAATPALSTHGFLFAVLAIAALILTAVLFGSDIAAGLVLANGAVATTRSLKEVVAEAKRIQDEYKNKPMPQDVGEKFDALCTEAATLQAEEAKQAEREQKLAAADRYLSTVPNPALPAGAARAEEQKADADSAEIAGYISVGELFTSSEVFRKYVENGARAGEITAPVEIKGLHGKFAPLTREQKAAVQQALRESKAVPTIGTGVLGAERVADVVRVREQDALRLRDLLNVSQTSANAVEWVKIVSYTRAAAPVAATAAKPEATMEVSVENTPVRTIAVWMPVTEQQLMDAPQITNMINNELLYDLDKAEEELIMYGSGTGQEFKGIVTDTAVLAGRTVTNDTNLDKIRRAMTDIRRAGYAPNGVAIDPLDWEGIVLLKGTDNRYLWTVVTDAEGDRVWGLRVVETVGAEANEGDTTEARNIVVGDWIRGATLWDRQQATVQVGWVNDQFIKNMRTIRAEKRAAFAVRRPRAFRKIQTQAAVPAGG